MRWCNVQTNEYDLQAIMYPTICTHHKLQNNDDPSFPGMYMQYVKEYDVTNISDTRPRKNMITMGKFGTSDFIMIITWAINISSQSPVIERTSSMLDTPPQDKLYRRLQFFNACEHFCTMMIMGDDICDKRIMRVSQLFVITVDCNHK